MSITMRGAEQPFLDLPPASGEPGRHRTMQRRATSYRAVFAIREFRTLWWAQVASYLGDQIAQVAIAVLVYGSLVATLGAYRALALDALSFCVSAALITGWVRPRPYSGEAPARPLLHTIFRDVTLIFRRPAARTLVLFGWLAGFAVVPEG